VTCLKTLAKLKAANTSFESPEVWVFDEDELRNARWEDEGHEFVLNGRLFDVLQVATKGESTTYLCYFDHFETNVLVAGNENDHSFLNQPLSHKNAKENVSLVSLDLFFERPQLFDCRLERAAAADYQTFVEVDPHHVFLDVPTIPPEILNS
jgi:hypothetical protein